MRDRVIPWPYAILLIIAGLIIGYWLLNGIPVFLAIILLLTMILGVLIAVFVRLGPSRNR